MIALDTNILVRLLTNDDPEQARQSALLIDSDHALFVPLTVLLELEWVLRGAYAISKPTIAKSFEALLSIKNLNIERSADVQQAIDLYLRGFDFADALHHCAAKGCTTFATFDKKFKKLAGNTKLNPPVVVPSAIKSTPK